MRALRMAAFLAATLLGTASAASATMITLQTSNLGAGFTGPFASVNYTLNAAGTVASFTFTSLTNGGYTYLLAGQGAVAVNSNGAATMQNFVAMNALPGFTTPGPVTAAGSGNEDGFGSFSNTADSFDGFQHSSTTITFDLVKTTGTWTSEANVLALNSGLAFAAAHVFACAAPCTSDGFATATGYAAGAGLTNPPPPEPRDNPGEVPEPASMALLGTGLVMLANKLRNR